jgi:hypothetical protein
MHVAETRRAFKEFAIFWRRNQKLANSWAAKSQISPTRSTPNLDLRKTTGG